MPKGIILISGRISSGKTTLARGLSEAFEYDIRRTKDWLRRRGSAEEVSSRMDLQRVGDKLDERTGGGWIAEELAEDLSAHRNTDYLRVDAPEPDH